MAAVYRIYAALMTALRALHKPVTLGVRVLVEDAEGRVLLVRHTYLPGWYLPGGGIKPRETLHQAAVRELAEETGILARETPRLFAAYTNFHQSKSDHVMLYVLRRFERRDWSPDFEIAECAFFAQDDLPADISPATRRRLEEVRTGARPALHW
ncbi:MAG: NUDIX domain-containing protein [Alphaproteobacteria bacterium]